MFATCLSLSRSRRTHRRRRDGLAFALPVALANALLASMLALLPAAASADRLSGTVVGARGNPKPAVLVDILGPTKAFTQTDGRGRFSVDVRKGRYIIRIRDDRRRAEIEVFVDGDFDRTFRLEW